MAKVKKPTSTKKATAVKKPRKAPVKKAAIKKTVVKKIAAKKPAEKKVNKPVKSAAVKQKPKNPNGMNHFQQCVVLAAVINQKRHLNPEFQTVPLPEITSSSFGPLREHLGQYAFLVEEIHDAIDELIRSDEFAKAFPVNNVESDLELTLEGNAKKIMAHLLELAGPEARKIIFMMEEGNKQHIHRTTLEKFALKTGQIEPHPLQHDAQKFTGDVTQKQILNSINMRTNPRYFGDQHPQNFSTKQRRGRG